MIFTQPFIMPLEQFLDDDVRWDAVRLRNPSADGLFVYGVRTTKVYCRPICKARLARRANVRFFAVGTEAQKAGFRPCKRCKPEIGGLMPDERAVRRIRAFVQKREPLAQPLEEGNSTRSRSGSAKSPADGDSDGMSSSAQTCSDEQARLSLAQMAKQTGLSKWHFHRVFKKCVGVTPVEYLRMERRAARASSEPTLMETPPLKNTNNGGGAGAGGEFVSCALPGDGVSSSCVSEWECQGDDDGAASDGFMEGSGGSDWASLTFDDIFTWPEDTP